MKILKEGHPARHIINWMNSPVSKRAKRLVRMSEQHDPLPYSSNIKISVALLVDFKDIKFPADIILVSSNIINMHTNIPTGKLENIVTLMPSFNQIDEKRIIRDYLQLQRRHATKLLSIQGQSKYTKKWSCYGRPQPLLSSQIYFCNTLDILVY